MRARASDLLLERQGELESARLAVAAAAAGQGRVLLVEGPAGIGKTRLLEAIASIAHDGGFEVHGARGDDLETGFGYGVLRQLLGPVLARLDPAERAVVLEGAASFLASLLEGTPGPLSSEVGDAEVLAAYGLYQVIQDLAERRPLMLLVDDAHWTDQPSLHALGFLARRLGDLPVLLLLGYRPAVDARLKDLLGRFDAVPGSVRLNPSPLGEEAVSMLARATLDRDIDTALCRHLLHVTGGNPFLIQELLAALLVDKQESADLEAKDMERLVPERVGQSVLRRVAAAGDQARTLADACAVLGEATLQEAAQLAGLDELEAVTAADGLVNADILVPGPHLRFAHPLLRQAVRAHIPPARRALAHGRAARLLGERGSPLDRVAAHLREALARGDAWVVETLLTAAARERERGSPETAVPLLARALAEPPPLHLRFRVTLTLAQAQAQTGHPDAVTTARQALAFAGGPSEEAEATLHLARTLALAGDFWSAVDLFDKQAAASNALDPDLALQVEAELLGAARLHRDTREEALARLDRLAPVALPPRPASVVLLANLALTGLERSEAPEKIAHLAQLALSEDWLVESGSFQFAYAAEALIFVDRLEEARSACDAAVEAAQRGGSVMLSVVAHGLRTELNLRRGAVAEAEADARLSYRLSAELADRGLPASGKPYGRAHLANALMARGEWDEAGRVLTDVETDERAEENPFFLHRRGLLRLAQGDAAAALSDFLESGRSSEGRGGVDTPSMLPWRSDAALALQQLSEEERAMELASQELDLARKQDVPGAIAEALIAIGLIEGGEHGIRRLRDAVDLLEGSPRVLTRVRGLTELGSMLRRNGDSRAAREYLVKALDLAHHHGATALGARAREELVIAGGRPRRPAVTGIAALTPSERRVARFVHEGLTNRQIAGRLFISARTVSAHLTHIYQKLGVASRAELNALLKDSV
ncbi:MAG: AAA family ATPase [Actinomycetota bacterium]|nr:AAA family ATPase [Actinomycetota bacterium]